MQVVALAPAVVPTHLADGTAWHLADSLRLIHCNILRMLRLRTGRGSIQARGTQLGSFLSEPCRRAAKPLLCLRVECAFRWRAALSAGASTLSEAMLSALRIVVSPWASCKTCRKFGKTGVAAAVVRLQQGHASGGDANSLAVSRTPLGFPRASLWLLPARRTTRLWCCKGGVFR